MVMVLLLLLALAILMVPMVPRTVTIGNLVVNEVVAPLQLSTACPLIDPA